MKEAMGKRNLTVAVTWLLTFTASEGAQVALLILLTREINGDDKRATLCPRFRREYRISGYDIRGSVLVCDVTSGIAKKKRTVKKNIEHFKV